MGADDPAAVRFARLDMTVYEEILTPGGAVKFIMACAFPATAVTDVGGAGILLDTQP